MNAEPTTLTSRHDRIRHQPGRGTELPHIWSAIAASSPLSLARRMTVIQGLYRDFGVAGFLMEQRVSYNPKLGHLPEVPDRLKFGGELVRAIAKALDLS